MRDPKRIDRICDLLKDVWKKTPDWRLGQLIVNYFGTDPFYIEDDLLEGAFKNLLNPPKKSTNNSKN